MRCAYLRVVRVAGFKPDPIELVERPLAHEGKVHTMGDPSNVVGSTICLSNDSLDLRQNFALIDQTVQGVHKCCTPKVASGVQHWRNDAHKIANAGVRVALKALAIAPAPRRRLAISTTLWNGKKLPMAAQFVI
eukprot:4203868-Pleurochrysis_carterae.AAC.4